MAGPKYQTYVVERATPADRTRLWPAIVDRIENSPPEGLTPELLSVEAPWRLVYRLPDAPTSFYEATVCLVPTADGSEGTIVVWSVLDLPDEIANGGAASFTERSRRALVQVVDELLDDLGTHR